MPLRLLLPLLLVCLGGGYAVGRLAQARWGDRSAAAATPPAAAQARAALAEVRAAPAGARRDELRRAFLGRFPRSWLDAHWGRSGAR